MALTSNAVVIGLTGSFGSGCTTLCSALAEHGFTSISLSKIVRDKWSEQNENKDSKYAQRRDLQILGDKLREEKGNAYLAESAFSKLEQNDKTIEKLVIDSIRNPDEANYYRSKFHNFFLVAIDATLKERWIRLNKTYTENGLTETNFKQEDKIDANEEDTFGQKVQLCVDDADILISNDNYFEVNHVQKEKLYESVIPYLKHIEKNDLLTPSPDESMMAIAYSIALKSTCYKRQVGAVIVDENGMIIAVGCNENPSYLGSCLDTYGECYRDIYKKRILEEIKQSEKCPNPECHEPLNNNISSKLTCKKCGFDLDKYFIRDRALSRCTALHAEETAIINARTNLKNCIIYTTTFPCMLCAEKILATGISTVVYCESYPDADSLDLFDKVKKNEYNLEIRKFKGVKARAYYRLFSEWRSQTEDRIGLKGEK